MHFSIIYPCIICLLSLYPLFFDPCNRWLFECRFRLHICVDRCPCQDKSEILKLKPYSPLSCILYFSTLATHWLFECRFRLHICVDRCPCQDKSEILKQKPYSPLSCILYFSTLATAGCSNAGSDYTLCRLMSLSGQV